MALYCEMQIIYSVTEHTNIHTGGMHERSLSFGLAIGPSADFDKRNS